MQGKRNAPLMMARVGVEIWAAYHDRWDGLRADAREVSVRLPMWMRDAMDLQRVGLPPDHPWNDRNRIPEWVGDAS